MRTVNIDCLSCFDGKIMRQTCAKFAGNNEVSHGNTEDTVYPNRKYRTLREKMIAPIKIMTHLLNAAFLDGGQGCKMCYCGITT